MNAKTHWVQTWRLVLLVGGICLAFSLSAKAQVQTNTSEASQAPTQETTVQRGEVVHVSGNDLIVKMEDGTIKHIANVPESARVTVDGKELGIHDLKPGMKLEKTVTTTTTPKIITTVKSVTGKVWHVTPPTSVILTLEDGTNQKFNIPKDQKFDVDGQMVDAWGLKKGMKISATKVVEEPMTEVEQQAKVTGQMPPPPPAPPSDAPILIALVTSAPAPAAAAAPAELPKTASFLPLLGLLGMLSTVSSFGLWAIRKIV